MEQITLSQIVTGQITRIGELTFERDPWTITLKIDEVDEWIADQEQVLGVKWLKIKREREPIGSIRIEKYHCHRFGKKQEYVSILPENKRRLIQKPSIKVGCKSYFWVRQRPDTDDVDIEYHWKHENHVPNAIDHFDYSRFPQKIRINFIY